MSANLIHNFLKPKSAKMKAPPIGGFQLGPSEAENGIKKLKLYGLKILEQTCFVSSVIQCMSTVYDARMILMRHQLDCQECGTWQILKSPQDSK